MKKHFLFIIIVMLLLHEKSAAQLPTGGTNIDVNNIDAYISSTSDLFWDYTNAWFNVPKDSATNAIYTAGIWMGGIDPGGAIELAGQTYRQTGLDFWPGPLDTVTGSAVNYLPWDRCWKVTAADVQNHIQNYNMPGYIVPPAIAEWPGYDASLGRILAPFADYNNNNIYDPENGDYPYIMGDMTVYSIFNESYIHTETNCNVVGVEVHRTTFGFDAPANKALNNTIFMRYEIKNYSTIQINNYYVSKWIDFDLGNSTDDYVGTDVDLNMIYCYNGDADDEGPGGYGLNPPAVGAYFLNQTLTSSLAYDNINQSPTGNPSGCTGFYNYMKGIWLDNQPVSYGGIGRDASAPLASYMYPDSSDPVLFTGYGPWSEFSAGNSPGDRRMLGSIGPFTLMPGDYLTFDVGYTYARADSGGPLASVAELQDAVSSLRVLYDNGQLTSVKTPVSSSIAIYPNPATDVISVSGLTGQKTAIQLFDSMGRMIYEKKSNSDTINNIDVSSLSRGIYFISVTSNDKREVKKVVLQ
jgi:hypothetical protein